MRYRNVRWLIAAILVVAAGLSPAPELAVAGIYPGNKCVAQKLRAAKAKCSMVLRAWSKWDRRQDDALRDAALTAAGEKFDRIWQRAEARATRKNVDCADTTAAANDIEGAVDTATLSVVTAINAGLDLAGTQDHRQCGAQLLKAAAAECWVFLNAESKYVTAPGNDRRGAKRGLRMARAKARFDSAWASATTGDCPTTATAAGVETLLDNLRSSVRADTTISPNVPTSWTMITPATSVPYLGKTLAPICSFGDPYVFFVKRGTVNKLLVYYQGGGACWDVVTCMFGAHKPSTGPSDNPALSTTGLADLTNPSNPFKDWNAVFVPYCTGDVHWGDAFVTHTYGGPSSIDVYHKGFVNAQVVEKWAREHFVVPEKVFVSGSSAGAYGAIMGAIYLRERTYPGATFYVLGDAGNGVITSVFLQNNIQKWGIEANLPRWIPALDVPITALSIVDLWTEAAKYYPDDYFAQYTTAWDGGSGSQTYFYNLMLHGNPADWDFWWWSSCDWNSQMRAFALDAATRAPNYRYYIGAGSRHTVWGRDKVYTDTTGGVPPVVDWINDMLAGDPGWTNEECATCDLLPGACSAGSSNPGASCQDDSGCSGGTCDGEDARPSPLEAPFGSGGAVTCP